MKKLIILFTFLFNICNAQIQSCRNLVFEGAGIRGIAYAGVIDEFEKAGVLQNVKKVGGTSAGAITALMVSLGYSADDICKIIYNTNFNKFNDGRFIFFGGFYRMKKNYGWYRGNKFEAWLEKLIEAKTSDGNITFMQFHNLGYKDLYVTATSLTQQKLIIFSYGNYPDMKVKDAVRISMSIPLYFEGIFIDSTGTIIKKPGDRTDLDLVVDGGIIGNFPISIFDTTIIDSQNNKTRKANPETIGIRIDSKPQIENDKSTKELTPLEIAGLKSYLEAFYIFVLENLNRNQLTEEDWERTISVSSEDIGPRVKKLSSAQKEKLINSGRQSVIQFMVEKN